MKRRQDDILIETSPGETRIGQLDADGALWRFDVDRLPQPRRVGAIYWGLIKKIDKKLNAAFLTIGAETDVMLNNPHALREGQKLLVEVTREARGQKGMLVSSYIKIRGRYLHWTPRNSAAKQAGNTSKTPYHHSGIKFAKSLGKGKLRAQLQADLLAKLPEDQDIFVQFPAMAVPVAVILAEWQNLQQQYAVLCAKADQNPAPGMLQPAPTLMAQTLMACAPHTRIAVEDRPLFARLQKQCQATMPDLVEGLLLHQQSTPMFEAVQIEDQLEEALAKEVIIPGGGTLIFEKTEAMHVVDVNMADGEKGGQSHTAILHTNKRAISCLARQISLRNLSGLIIVDLLKIRDKQGLRLLRDLANRLIADEIRQTQILGITAAGLLEITRQRTSPDLQSMMQVQSPTRPRILPVAQACAILRAAVRLRGAGQPVAYGSPDVIETLRNQFSPALAKVEAKLGRDLRLKLGDDKTPPLVEMQ